MFDSLSVPVPSLSSLLILGGLFLVLIYLYSRSHTPLDGVKGTSSSKQLLETDALRTECLRLREQLQQRRVELTTEFHYSTFEQLQSLLTNYPSVRQLVQVKPDIPAKNLISLFTPLDNLIESWGYKPIGQAWEQIPYDPQLHQPDADDIEVGELVYIRFVGYRDGDSPNDGNSASRILCPAKVSRTLPSGIKR